MNLVSYVNPLKTTFNCKLVDVLATAAAFFRMTVHQVSLQRTASNHRHVEFT